MRGGERPPVRRVYWLLATIYLVAAVGYAAATLGEDAATALVAGSHLLAVVPAAAAAGLGEATRIAVELVPQPPTEESEAWHDTMDAWVQGFMHDYRTKRTFDRRRLNGGRSMDRQSVKKDWPLMARWVQAVEMLQRKGDLTPYASALRQRGIARHRQENGRTVYNEEHGKMLWRLHKWTQEPRREQIMQMAAASRN